MTKRVWKYVLGLQVPTVFEMPEGAEILHVHDQNGSPCFWALVNDTHSKVKRIFYVRGTGMDVIRNDAKYIGSTHDDGFVWHVFEIPEFTVE